MTKKKTIVLTETKLTKLVSNAVKKIIKESMFNKNNNIEQIEVSYDYNSVDDDIFDFLNEYFDNNPDVDDKLTIDYTSKFVEGDEGDYWHERYGDSFDITLVKVDSNNKFKNILPEEMYKRFIHSIENIFYDYIAPEIEEEKMSEY